MKSLIALIPLEKDRLELIKLVETYRRQRHVPVIDSTQRGSGFRRVSIVDPVPDEALIPVAAEPVKPKTRKKERSQ